MSFNCNFSNKNLDNIFILVLINYAEEALFIFISFQRVNFK